MERKKGKGSEGARGRVSQGKEQRIKEMEKECGESGRKMKKMNT